MSKDNGNALVCFKNSDEICKYINEDPNNVTHLVEYESLPAWRRNGKGPWRALNRDLDLWLIFQRDKYLEDSMNVVEKEKNKRNLQYRDRIK